jgi:hypothetical protein
VILEKCTESQLYAGTRNSLQILIDFSETEEFDDILAIKKLLLTKKEDGISISGIIALNIGKIDHTLIKSLAEDISKIIVSTGKDTTLSFSHSTFPAESVSVVPQLTIDDVIKKSLEPVVLSLLDKPISGMILFMRSITGTRFLFRRQEFTPSFMNLRKTGTLRSRFQENPSCIALQKREKITSTRNSMISSGCSNIS